MVLLPGLYKVNATNIMTAVSTPMERPWHFLSTAGSAILLLSVKVVSWNGILVFSATTVLAVVLIVLLCWLIRRHTYHRLIQRGLPTVFWRPKFWTYESRNSLHSSSDRTDNGNDAEQAKKLPSSTITNILPRMKAMDGPYSMYGTVYGLSTAVVHVAHPTPALAILSASSKTTTTPPSSSTSRNNNSGWNKKTTLTESTGVVKAPAYNHFHNFCGQGVFTADGNDWKQKRAAVLHALLMRDPSTKATNAGWEAHLEDQVHRTATELVQTLSEQCREGNDDSSTLNIVPVLQRSTIGLIYRYITHADLRTTKSTKSLLSWYLESVIRIRLIILAQSRSVWFLLPRWVYQSFSSLFREEQTTMIPIREFAKQACREARPGSPLDALRQRPLYQPTPKPSKSPDADISDNILFEAITLLFAGQDTSAATLSWTLHLLSLHPKIQAQVAEEVHSIMSSHDHHLNKRDIAKMPLLDAVLKESMRLYPVAPFVVRKITQEIELPTVINPVHGDDKGRQSRPAVHLPKGALACVWIYGLHRNPDFWTNPDAFQPERWLQSAPVPGTYMPFAHGPRNCLGQPLAHIILRTLLAHLLYSFDFTLPPGESPMPKDMQVGFTVLPRGGVSLRLRKRQRNSTEKT